MSKIGENTSQENIEISQVADNVAEFLKTLANPNRLIILSYLREGESCVGDLEKRLNISQSALSQHLSRMRGEGILVRRRESQQIFYSINDDRVGKFLDVAYEVFCKKQ